ncbi:MAG: hypothetical protein WCD65_18120, partial [Pseudolabrys sp.]
QYVVRKLHLLEAHRINSGDDVLVAVIDSKIDSGHPDLAGVIGRDRAGSAQFVQATSLRRTFRILVFRFRNA